MKNLLRKYVKLGKIVNMDTLKQFKKRKNDRKISDIYTGDDIERDDFGNLWTDWSIDPDDYLG